MNYNTTIESWYYNTWRFHLAFLAAEIDLRWDQNINEEATVDYFSAYCAGGEL